MRLFSVLLVLCLTLNSFASSGADHRLLEAIDEYNYSLAVEWDQKDEAYFQKRTEVFLNAIENSVLDGLTLQELNQLIIARIKDKTKLEGLKLELAQIKNQRDYSEISLFLKKNSAQFYNRGASWNGEVIGSVAGGLAVAALVGWVIWFRVTHECVAWTEKWECTSSQIGNTTNSSCGWVNVCSVWKKK